MNWSMSCCLRRALMTGLRWHVRAQALERRRRQICRAKKFQALRKHRERLAALVGGGEAKQYLGKAFTLEALDDAKIEKLYARYEARLGAAMTKTLGSAALQLYAIFFPIPAENQPALVADLEADPFVGSALSNATCELYHRHGMFLSPLTAALTTMKHCQFGHQCPQTINDDEEPKDDGRGGKSNEHSSS